MARLSPRSLGGFSDQGRIPKVAGQCQLLKIEDQERAERIERDVWNLDLRIRVDWFALLHDLVEGRRGLAEELLAQLNRNRNPGLSHLMLAHLAKRLGWRLLLTLNHDSLLEKAFLTEGIVPKVFDVNMASGVPDHALLRREPLSLVKLHGSAFGLRLGESTNDELDDATRDRLLHYIPEDAVLLVLGFSGYERRMMSLIEAIATPSGGTGWSRQIVWMYWGKPELPVERLRQRLTSKSKMPAAISLFRLDDAGSFLKGLYQRITNTLPSTNTPYPALPKRVRPDSPQTDKNQSTSGDEDDTSDRRRVPQEPVHLFLRDTIWHHAGVPQELVDGAPKKSALPPVYYPLYASHRLVRDEMRGTSNGAKAMAAFVQSLRGYDTIWIDLEDHHTVTGVVADMISQLRVFDPTLPPLVLPIGDSKVGGGEDSEQTSEEEGLDRAVRYLHRSIRRGRYIFAFDSIEGFGRPQTVHHGLVSLNDDFLETLCVTLSEIHEKSASSASSFESLLDLALEGRLKKNGPRIIDVNKIAKIAKIRSDVAKQENRLVGYERLRRLLDFFEKLLAIGEDPSPSGRINVQSPRDVDWYFCLSADIPQPRHWDKLNGGARHCEVGKIAGAWELAFHATVRFVKNVTTPPSSRESHLHNSAARSRCHNIVCLGEQHDVHDNSKDLLQTHDRFTNIKNAFISAFENDGPNHRAGGFSPPDTKNIEMKLRDSLAEDICELVGRSFAYDGPPRLDQHSNSSHLSQQTQHSAFLFLTMCLFRRPRNRSSLVSVFANRLRGLLEPTDLDCGNDKTATTAFDLDACLQPLLVAGVVHRSEGEMYFIHQHVHEAMYTILSRPFRLNTLKQAPVQDLKRVLKVESVRLLWLGRMHSLVAREYYINVWQRSGDTHALFEYFYHRMASLRYMMMLRTLVQVALNTGFEFVKSLLKTNQDDPKSHVAFMQLLGPFTDGSGDSDFDVLRRIDELRHQYISALINVLDRERTTLLTSATGDTWLNWIQQLVSVDLTEVFGGGMSIRGLWAKDSKTFKERVSESLKNQLGFSSDKFRDAWAEECVAKVPGLNVEFRDVRQRLHIVLTEIKGLLFREMGEFEQCIDARLELLELMGVLKHSDGDSKKRVSQLIGHPKKSAGQFEVQLANRTNAFEKLKLFLASVGRNVEVHRNWYPTMRSAISMVESIVIDIAASVRHLRDKNQRDVNDPRLDLLLLVGCANAAIVLRNVKHATIKAGLQVAALRCRFEALRIRADSLLVRRFQLAYPRRKSPSTLPQKESKSGRRDLRKEVLDVLREVALEEREVYGAPFVNASDFVLQVSRFATLRASLLSLVKGESLAEALRLFEEAESGFTPSNPDHVFHRVIIHTQRAYALMLAADEASRLRKEENDRTALGERDHLGRIVGRRPVAHRYLTEARAELTHAENILGTGRRNARVWLRLYRAKAQLAIEEVLHLAMVVAQAPDEVRRVDRFASQLQDSMLFGLEAIRGALDCTKYPHGDIGVMDQKTSAPMSLGGLADPRLLQDVSAEHEETSGSYSHYLFLFVACRVVIKGYVASCNEATFKDETVGNVDRHRDRMLGDPRSEYDQFDADAESHKRWMQRVQELLEFPAQWKALSESVGLERAVSFFDENGPKEIRLKAKEARNGVEPPLNWVSWTVLCDRVCDRVVDFGWHGNADEPASLREIAQDRMVRMMSAELAEDFGQRCPKREELKGLPWVIHQLFLQRNDLRRSVTMKNEVLSKLGESART